MIKNCFYYYFVVGVHIVFVNKKNIYICIIHLHPPQSHSHPTDTHPLIMRRCAVLLFLSLLLLLSVRIQKWRSDRSRIANYAGIAWREMRYCTSYVEELLPDNPARVCDETECCLYTPKMQTEHRERSEKWVADQVNRLCDIRCHTLLSPPPLSPLLTAGCAGILRVLSLPAHTWLPFSSTSASISALFPRISRVIYCECIHKCIGDLNDLIIHCGSIHTVLACSLRALASASSASALSVCELFIAFISPVCRQE